MTLPPKNLKAVIYPQPIRRQNKNYLSRDFNSLHHAQPHNEPRASETYKHLPVNNTAVLDVRGRLQHGSVPKIRRRTWHIAFWDILGHSRVSDSDCFGGTRRPRQGVLERVYKIEHAPSNYNVVIQRDQETYGYGREPDTTKIWTDFVPNPNWAFTHALPKTQLQVVQRYSHNCQHEKIWNEKRRWK